MGQKTYRERCIADFGWDPIEPMEGVSLRGDVRANTVQMLTELCGFEEQEDGTFTRGDTVATIEPYYCLPYPLLDNGAVIGREISHMLTTYRQRDVVAPSAGV